MKVLICLTEYPPSYASGIGTVVYNVVEELKKMGIDCVVCSPSGPDIKLGSPILFGKFGIAGLLYYWIRVSNYFKDDSFDFELVWLQNPLFLLKNPFKRSLVTFHSTYHGLAIMGVYPKSYYNIAAKIEKYCLNKINEMHFTGVGTNICDELEKMGIDEKRITYIPNGVNTNKFKPVSNKRKLRKGLGLSEDNLIILSLGRLTYQKQPQKLLEVFSIIEKEIENVTLVFAGNGKLFDELKEYALNKNINNIKFLGYVPDEILPDLCATSDYFIIASKYEGGEPILTLAEAMASGLPSIVSNIQNFKFIEDAKAGIVVDFSKIERTADTIVEYLKKDNSNHSINAREYVVKNLDWKIIAERYVEEFEKIISGDNNE